MLLQDRGCHEGRLRAGRTALHVPYPTLSSRPVGFAAQALLPGALLAKFTADQLATGLAAFREQARPCTLRANPTLPYPTLGVTRVIRKVNVWRSCIADMVASIACAIDGGCKGTSPVQAVVVGRHSNAGRSVGTH